MRDQKIDSLYEGTTHIQALDLLFRKIIRDGGATLTHLLGRVQKTLASEEGGAELASERGLLTKALGELQGILQAMLVKLEESGYHAGLQANRILVAVAEVVIAWLLLRHAAVALQKLPQAKGADIAFYQGKIASARYFAANVLPNVTLTRKLIQAGDLSLMHADESWF